MSAKTPPITPSAREQAAQVLAQRDILVKVDMGLGDAEAKSLGLRPDL